MVVVGFSDQARAEELIAELRRVSAGPRRIEKAMTWRALVDKLRCRPDVVILDLGFLSQLKEGSGPAVSTTDFIRFEGGSGLVVLETDQAVDLRLLPENNLELMVIMNGASKTCDISRTASMISRFLR
ncbi:MAG: hypothetical protein BWY68_00618 [bacterium ADurb.Bin400]|nr:MAG: hypothetical protein BWY68_00618 [bacterium ADurb.Bin400]